MDEFIGLPVLRLRQLVHSFGLNGDKVVGVSPISRLLSLYFFDLIFEAVLSGLRKLMLEHYCGRHL